MKRTKVILQTGALALSLMATGVMAAVSAEEAAKLGNSLTPLGGEKAGNADGSIPAWTGGLKPSAGKVDDRGFLDNPFAGEQPLFTITAQNMDQYKDKLTPGQQAMLKRYPNSYRMPVYPSRRSAAAPAEIYEIAKRNAVNARTIDNGNGVENFETAYPFPIPQDGAEAIWNHLQRWRGYSVRRYLTQIAPQTNGSFNPVFMRDEFILREKTRDYVPGKSNVMSYFKQQVTAPSRLAGNVLLVHETLNQATEPRQAWVYNAGQRRVRRAPQVSYDGPGTAADGQRTADGLDMFNGAIDRYDWKLVGKKEIYMAYNAFKLDSPDLKYADIIRAGHLNQDLTRYELHRVWHVIATLKPEFRHIYPRREFFIDEDSWIAGNIDHYDARDNLWRVGEAQLMPHYAAQVPYYAAEALYDLVNGRYIVNGLRNQEQAYEYNFTSPSSEFTPAALRQEGIR